MHRKVVGRGMGATGHRAVVVKGRGATGNRKVDGRELLGIGR